MWVENCCGLSARQHQPNFLLFLLQLHLCQMVTTIWHRRSSIWPSRCTGSWTRARTLASSTVWQQCHRVVVACCLVAMIVMMSCRHRCHPPTIFIDCGSSNDSQSPINTFFLWLIINFYSNFLWARPPHVVPLIPIHFPITYQIFNHPLPPSRTPFTILSIIAKNSR